MILVIIMIMMMGDSIHTLSALPIREINDAILSYFHIY